MAHKLRLERTIRIDAAPIALSDGSPDVLKLLVTIGKDLATGDAWKLFQKLDRLGIYGLTILDFFKSECNRDMQRFVQRVNEMKSPEG